MAKIKLITKTVVTKLDKRFTSTDFIEKSFKDRINRTAEQMEAFLTSAVEAELRKNKFIRALTNPMLGVRGQDLPAEFGLTEAEASTAVSLILRTLLKTCKVTVKKKGKTRTVDGNPSATIVIRSSFFSDIHKLDRDVGSEQQGKTNESTVNYPEFAKKPFVYPSKNGDVPWMAWVLHGSNKNSAVGISPDLKRYGILYNLSPKQKDERSRSGRALMVREFYETKSGRRRSNHGYRGMAMRFFPYEFPEAARPSGGARNFIDEIAKNTKFLQALKNRLDSIIRNNLTPRKR